MKSTRIVMTITSLVLVAVFCILTSCDESNLTNPKISDSQGIPASEIQFIQWKPAVSKNLQSLSKVTTSEKVFTQGGGTLATVEMMGCELIVPANAFDDDERLIQANLISEDNSVAGLSFLPSQQFTKYVTIVLPFEVLNVDENTEVNDIRAFWLDEDSNLWMEIHDVIIDDENRVVKTQIDHFTRFGWGF